jgi:hypothetical protein
MLFLVVHGDLLYATKNSFKRNIPCAVVVGCKYSSVINILLFVTSLCSGLVSIGKSVAKEESQEQDGQEDEKALEKLLHGENVNQ